MITFHVVKEPRGWAIRTCTGMTTPFRTKDAAIFEARYLAETIRCHGECVEIIVETSIPPDIRGINQDSPTIVGQRSMTVP
jgi:hypothetical protein